MKKNMVILVMLLILTSILFASCGNKTDTNNADVTNDENNAEEKSNNDESTSLSELKNLVMKKAEYKVTYDIKQSSNEQSFDAVQTLVMKGNNMKYEMVTEQGKTMFYYLDEKVYSCMDMSSQKMCFEMESSSAENPTKNQDELVQNFDDLDITMKSSREIAGTTAKCFEYGFEEAKVEYCFSKEGVPLYMKMLGMEEFNFEMTAKDYSTDVSDSEFTLPTTPTSFPGMN
jgi:hypothetical protein